MPVSKSQRKAADKWDAANKEKKKKIVEKSHAKSFVIKYANRDDLDWLEELIAEKRKNDGN